ncbi:MAG: rhodanese-like domain-containing protein [Hydrotalea flava]|uniref:rhodanese-like domain-containing protein n=1 Tax=Hydrotalea TaxID=1004300 RepID=UPI0009465513|nr:MULTISPECIES: rhodanese-like domain-containing protein [Hydrotalea]MBY0346854.1 rhodanese-like domain-containing protein [Hydrotalea flava]NIM35785.1 rhodanese-like domain-containing protein [Hydrotalea flava]NIM38635.1 rhodanese-like domain-containing protein [Hydrotalea flava]NIN03819.1 rhodanese-like domain-containing protein [Hydrotalea flava]NIN15513.1 rhodanese-like domain-containing protein [Hydrotalea flava]
MKVLSVDDLKMKIENGEPVNLIDVREPHENAEFNIGGILLPLGKVQTMQIEAIEDLKEEPIIVYCRSGNRSMQAAMILEQLGFSDVTNLAGGMLAWEDKFGR